MVTSTQIEPPDFLLPNPIMGRPEHRHNGTQSPDIDTVEVKRETSTDNDLAAEMSSTRVSAVKDEPLSRSTTPLSTTAKVKTQQSSSAATPRLNSETTDIAIRAENAPTNGHDSAGMEPVQSKKSVRRSKKPPARVAPLFNDLPDATEEANSGYQVIESCIYQNKYLGYTEHAMDCDCTEEWGESSK